MNNKEKESQTAEKAEKKPLGEKRRSKGKTGKVENKARSTVGKARARKAGQEAVSDQKSHEYH